MLIRLVLMLTTLPPISSPSDSNPTRAHATFDDLVGSYRMPPPGPDFYRARRQLWLTPRADRSLNISTPEAISTSRASLEDVLRKPEAVYSDSCWKRGIGRVWKGLSKGEHLKHRLPLSVIVRPAPSKNRWQSFNSPKIKVVHASWVRDDTWPAGLRAPEPDDELPDELLNEPMVLEHKDGTNPLS